MLYIQLMKHIMLSDHVSDVRLPVCRGIRNCSTSTCLALPARSKVSSGAPLLQFAAQVLKGLCWENTPRDLHSLKSNKGEHITMSKCSKLNG